MGLKGKLTSQTSIKSDGNMFYELIRYRLNELSEICPKRVHSVELCEGQWGSVGSVIGWNFLLDGKNMGAKEVIEGADEGKKSITYNVIEGEMMELYKALRLTVTIDMNGEDNLVMLSLEYEKKTEAIPEPQLLIDLCVAIVKDIECHHRLVPN